MVKLKFCFSPIKTLSETLYTGRNYIPGEEFNAMFKKKTKFVIDHMTGDSVEKKQQYEFYKNPWDFREYYRMKRVKWKLT